MHIASDASDQSLQTDNVLEFPRGLPGFDSLRHFRLLHEEGPGEPTVHWLQSVEDDSVQLSVTDPSSLQVNYEIALDDEECELLQLEQAEQCALLVILYRAETGGDIRANLLAPLLINTERRIGLQKVLNAVERNVTIRAL